MTVLHQLIYNDLFLVLNMHVMALIETRVRINFLVEIYHEATEFVK